MKASPRFRDDVEIDLNHAIKKSIFNQLEGQLFPFKNCLNCKLFNEKQELCTKWNARPPARVIAFGCPSHDDIHSIPF